MKCTNCGSDLKPGASFCTNCGHKVETQIVETNNNQCDSSSNSCSCNSNCNGKRNLIAIAGIVVLILIFALGLRSCSGLSFNAKKAEKLVQKHYDEILDLNFDKAMQYVSSESLKFPFGSIIHVLDFEQLREIYQTFGKDIIKMNVEVDEDTFVKNGDKASATMALEMKIDSKLYKNETGAIIRFDFVKENGKWLIDDAAILADFDF